MHLQLQQAVDETGIPRVDTTPQVVEALTLHTDLLLTGAHVVSVWRKLPFGDCRGPAAPGNDKVTFPHHTICHTSTTPTTRGRRWSSPGVESPFYRLIYD